MAKLTRGGQVLLGFIVIITLYIVFFRQIREFFAGSQGTIEPPAATPTGTFTMYYADWCGHCQRVKPIFSEMASQSPIRVGGRTVNIQMISPEKEPDKAKDVKIDGFPTFIFKNAKTGAQTPYNGDRTLDGFMAFLQKQVTL